MSNPDHNTRLRLEQILGLVLLFFLLMGCFLVMKPFLTAAMWAAILGFSLWPVHRRVLGWCKGRRTLAALTTTLAVALVLVVPFLILGFSLADDARALGSATRKWVESGSNAPPAWVGRLPMVGEKAAAYWRDLADDLSKLSQQVKRDAALRRGGATNVTIEPDGLLEEPTETTDSKKSEDSHVGSRLISAAGKFIANAQPWLLKGGLAIGRGIAEVMLSVFLVFFIFRDGEAVAERLKNGITRIAGGRGRHLVELAGNTVRGVVYGILGTALVQGVMAAIGFVIAGVPGAALLGLLTFLLSVLPMGPPLIWIPASIWLFSQGSTGWGIFMIVWGIGVSSVDNVVKPWLISQGSDMPFVLIFFGVLGGAFAFGFIGVFIGPTLLAVAYRLIEEWSANDTSGDSKIDSA